MPFNFPLTASFYALLIYIASFSILVFAEPAPQAEINFIVNPVSASTIGYSSRVFVVSENGVATQGFTNFQSALFLPLEDGQYTLFLIPEVASNSRFAISGKFPLAIHLGKSNAIGVTPVSICVTHFSILHADGSPISNMPVHVVLDTYSNERCPPYSFNDNTTDSMGCFDFRFIPGEKYYLKMQLIEFGQAPIFEMGPYTFEIGLDVHKAIRLDAIPQIKFIFQGEKNGKRINPEKLSPHIVGRPGNAGDFYYSLRNNGALTIEFSPNSVYKNASSLELSISNYSLKPKEVNIKDAMGKVIDIVCSPIVPTLVPTYLPFTVSATMNGGIPPKSFMEMLKLSPEGDKIEVFFLDRKGDEFIAHEAAGKCYLALIFPVNGGHAMFLKSDKVEPGGKTELHIDHSPHKVIIHLLNTDSSFIENHKRKIVIIDAKTKNLAGYPEDPHESTASGGPDPSTLSAELFPGNYMVIEDNPDLPSFNYGSIAIPSDESTHNEFSLDYLKRALIKRDVYTQAMINDLRSGQ